VLLLRDLERLRQVRLGFDPEGVVTVQLSPFVPGREEERIRKSTAYFERMVSRLREIPGVVAVGGTDKFPFTSTYATRPTQAVEVRGDLQADVVHRAPAGFIDVTPGYFEAMHIPLLEGRGFREDDDLDAPWAIILSERAAASLFPGRSALGRQVRINTAGVVDPWATVVGVVGNVRYRASDADTAIEFYYPYKQYGLSTTRLALRLAQARPGLEAEIRKAAADVDPETPVEDVRALGELVSETLWQRRAWSTLLSAFALTALVLAGLGLYGVLAFSVAERTREIGLRMALGSLPRGVVALVARESCWLVAQGLTLGLAAAALVARALGSLLFGVRWFDPLTYVFVGLVLAAAGLLAALLPAVRAARVDPLTALRAE
jgi:predicted permease